MNINPETRPGVILSAHLKGGCGKTTVLVDLGISMAMNGKKVVAVDTDMQGAMLSTLTGAHEQSYSPRERGRYLDDLKSGVGLRKPVTNYPEVNEGITVMHYPIEMFYHDPISKPEFEQEFTEILEGQTIDAAAVLVDMPPVRLASDEVRMFTAMSPFVDQFTFLIVNRPTPKEIEDGARCYKYIRELMIGAGIEPERIKPLLVLNFVEVLGDNFEYDLFNWGGTLQMRKGDQHRIAPSPFITPEPGEVGVPIPKIRLANIMRVGRDLHHYSVLLDGVVDLNELRRQEYPLDIVEATHKSAIELSDLLRDKPTKRRTEDYREYLDGIRQLRAAILPNKKDPERLYQII